MVVAVAEEAVNAVVVVTANGEVAIVLKLREVDITRVHARTKMALLSRVKRLNTVVVEAEETTTAIEQVVEKTEAIGVVIAATTVVTVTEEAEIVQKKSVRLNRLSNNNKLSELDRAIVWLN